MGGIPLVCRHCALFVDPVHIHVYPQEDAACSSQTRSACGRREETILGPLPQKNGPLTAFTRAQGHARAHTRAPVPDAGAYTCSPHRGARATAAPADPRNSVTRSRGHSMIRDGKHMFGFFFLHLWVWGAVVDRPPLCPPPPPLIPLALQSGLRAQGKDPHWVVARPGGRGAMVNGSGAPRSRFPPAPGPLADGLALDARWPRPPTATTPPPPLHPPRPPDGGGQPPHPCTAPCAFRPCTAAPPRPQARHAGTPMRLQHPPPPRDVFEGGARHLPFQVLDASAIEGIRGLMGESSSIYTVEYRCIRPLPPLPPPPSVSRRDGRTWAPILRGRLEGGGGGLARTPPSSQGPPMVPAKGGPKNLKLKSTWHRRRRRKILAVSLKHWKGRGGGVQGGVPPPLLRCTAVLIHHCPQPRAGCPAPRVQYYSALHHPHPLAAHPPSTTALLPPPPPSPPPDPTTAQPHDTTDPPMHRPFWHEGNALPTTSGPV